MLPIVVAPAASSSQVTDDADGGIRREPEIPEHEAIAPEHAVPAREEFTALDDEPDDDAQRAKQLQDRFRGVARQAAEPIPKTASNFEADRMKNDRLNLYFDRALSAELENLAARQKVSKSQIVEAALASYLSPDAADQRETAIVRRLDRLTRAIERLERDLSISTEALALFVKFWLMTTSPLPDTMRNAAQAKGRERYDGFVEALGRRLAKGSTLTKEVSEDVDGRSVGQ